jgi:hypothetical protein
MKTVYALPSGLALALLLAACGRGAGQPTSEPTATPDLVGGVAARPLAIGDAVAFPDDLAMIIETGCWQCDGPTEGLERVYRNPAGEIVVETLFSAEKMGLEPRVVQTDKGPQNEEPTITGSALTYDASRILVSVCTRGTCLEMGAPPGEDAQTTLFESTDGGVTWEVLDVLDGGLAVRAITEDGLLLADFNPQPGVVGIAYRLYPGGKEISPPEDALSHRVFATPDGALIWGTADGRLLRSDGSEYLSLGRGGNSEIVAVSIGPGPEPLAAVSWFEEEGYSGTYYMAILNPDGNVRKAYRTGDLILPGVWVSALMYGNAGVPPGRLPGPAPDLYLEWLPVAFDVDGDRALPIVDPFLEMQSRNLVRAVIKAPAAQP